MGRMKPPLHLALVGASILSLFLLQLVAMINPALCFSGAAATTPASGSPPGSYAVQPFVFPTPSSTVIPAFPEQSDVAGTCPLELPDELFAGVSHACSRLIETSSSSSAAGSTPSSTAPTPTTRLRCCPSLAAWLYAAHSSAALQSTRFLQSGITTGTPSLTSPPAAADLPVLPDDSEACADAAEKALRARGVPLARANETCGAVYCYCGIRLRPLSCPGGGIRVEKVDGRWVTVGDDSAARTIERDCDGGSAVEGCSRCLRSLYQLRKTASGNTSSSGSGADKSGGFGAGDCELVGLTWLLASNRTRYLPVVTRVLRTLMFSPTGSSPPSSCSDTFPIAVGSEELDEEDLEAVDEASSAPAGNHRSLFLTWTNTGLQAAVVLLLMHQLVLGREWQ